MKDFSWLEGMEYEKAKVIMLGHVPYFLYPYYVNGKNIMKIHDLNQYRIHVRVENEIIVNVNGTG